jgi:predicted DNA-binding transcriptional regulator AlpA
VTTAWIYTEIRRGRIPHIRLGRYVRYRQEAIEARLDRSDSDVPTAG